MSRIALINIDTQQSFHHRPYWQEGDIPASAGDAGAD